MEHLNKQISQIFNNLIESRTKFISKIDYDRHAIVYTIDSGLQVILSIGNYLKGKEPWDNNFSTIEKVLEYRGAYWPFCCEIEPDAKYSLVFILNIDGRNYYVPELSRMEKAQAIETIEQTIAAYESSLLCKISEATVEDEF